MRKILFSNRAQTEVIVTVLLIIIGLAAMAVLSGFVFNFVKDKLKSGDCVKTIGQLMINTDNDESYFDSRGKFVVVNIERGDEAFDLAAIKVSLGNGESSKVYTIAASGSDSAVSMLDLSEISLPAKFEAPSYNISVGDNIAGVDRVKIVPVLANGKMCSDSAVEAKIISK